PLPPPRSSTSFDFRPAGGSRASGLFALTTERDNVVATGSGEECGRRPRDDKDGYQGLILPTDSDGKRRRKTTTESDDKVVSMPGSISRLPTPVPPPRKKSLFARSSCRKTTNKYSPRSCKIH